LATFAEWCSKSPERPEHIARLFRGIAKKAIGAVWPQMPVNSVEEEAQEFAQTVIGRLLSKSLDIPTERHLVALAKKVMKREAISGLRKLKRRAAKRTRLEDRAKERQAHQRTPLQIVETEELADLAFAELAELPAPNAEAFALVVVEGLTDSQAGKVIGAEPGTVRQRVYRARRALRARLRDGAL